jgi:hypothetical protein
MESESLARRQATATSEEHSSGETGLKRTGVISSFAKFTIIAAIIMLASSGYAQDVEPTPWATVPSTFDCSPKVLKRDQPLVLTLGPGHGRELAIHSLANNKWYFLVVESPPPEMHAIMTPEDFAKATRVILPPNVVGMDWSVQGVESQIFTKPGQYMVYSSSNLESEDGGFRCAVSYRG